MSIEGDVQQPGLGTLVTMFKLELTDSPPTVFYYTPMVREDSTQVVWDGDTYVPLPIEASGFEIAGNRPFPRPKIRLSNVLNTGAGIAALLGDDALGATVTRIRTFRQYLDDGSTPDPTAHFPLDVYRIERKTAHNPVFLEWELAAVVDQEGKKLPGRQVLQVICTHRYRVWVTGTTFDYTKATCPYVGTDYFDINGTVVTAEFDQCGKRLSDCQLRFPLDTDTLPTRAFPTVGRTF